MTIEIALLISVVSVSFGLYQGVTGMKRNHKQDSRDDASQMTTVIVKLENIGTGITEIKTELNGMKEEIKELRDRLIINEQSVRSAWKQIDEIKGDGT